MAQRYGGKFSPDTTGDRPHAEGGRSAPPPRNAFDGKRRSRAGGRSNMLFLAPFIFVLTAFLGTPANLIFSLAAFGFLILAAWLTREGILAQEAYDARRVARRPAFPRKIAGSLMIGAGLFFGGLTWAASGAASGAAPGAFGFLYPVAFGIIGAALHLFSFGPDPMADKGMEGVDSFQTDRVARAVDEGEVYLKGMKDAILRAGDRSLEARVDRFADTARQLFRTVEGDPRDLTAARKYLSVYLMGARDATVKFADLFAQNRSTAARAEYESLLTDLETNFAARTQALLSDDHADLDVEIAVLRERLQYESPVEIPIVK